MSVQTTCKTVCKDQSILVEALEEIYGKGKIAVHEKGVEVTGYYSKKRPQITVNVSGLYGTAGYLKNEDGSFELVYDSTDRSRLKDIIPQKVRGGKTVDKLAQTYAKCSIARTLKGRSFTTTTQKDGSIKMQVRVVAY